MVKGWLARSVATDLLGEGGRSQEDCDGQEGGGAEHTRYLLRTLTQETRRVVPGQAAGSVYFAPATSFWKRGFWRKRLVVRD